MGLSDAPLLFAFEHASSENFTYIPMIVRFNLDRFGLRISLEQWQLLPLEDRKLLARFPADEDTAIEPQLRSRAVRNAAYARGPRPLVVPAGRAADLACHRHRAGVARAAERAGRADGARAAQWQRLAPFQRYVLVKLSRKPKLNHDFLPAMREFGLTATH